MASLSDSLAWPPADYLAKLDLNSMPAVHALPSYQQTYTPNQNINPFQQNPTPLTVQIPQTPLLQQPYTPSHRPPPSGLRIQTNAYHPAHTPMYSAHGYNSSPPPPFSPTRPRIVSPRRTLTMTKLQPLIPLTCFQQQSTCPTCKWEQSHAPLPVSTHQSPSPQPTNKIHALLNLTRDTAILLRQLRQRAGVRLHAPSSSKTNEQERKYRLSTTRERRSGGAGSTSKPPHDRSAREKTPFLQATSCCTSLLLFFYFFASALGTTAEPGREKG